MAEYSEKTLSELGQLMLKLRKNPKTSKTIARAVNEIDPSVKFPDLETDDLRSEMNRRFAEQDEARDREEAMRRLAAQRRRVSERYDNDPKHVQAIEGLMQKYGLLDYEAAAKLYAAEQPAPTPRQEPRPTANWHMPDIKALMENPLRYEREEAFKAIDEINANRTNH